MCAAELKNVAEKTKIISNTCLNKCNKLEYIIKVK